MTPTIPPGTIGISTIDGRVGAFVKFGQWFMGGGKDSKWSHVFLVGDGDTVYQAMPHGLERAKLSDYLSDLDHGDEVMFINVPLTDGQRAGATAYGDELVARGVGYSFATYLSLFLKRLGVNTERLRRRIADSGDLICSQAVDQILTHGAIFRVFNDGRSYLDVIPADFPGLVRDDPRFTIIDIVKVEAV